MGGVVGEIQKILFFHWNSILKIFPPLGVLHHHIPTPSSGSLVHRITGGFFSELLHSPLAVLCSMRKSFLLSLTSVKFSSALSCVWLSATPWTAACQGSLSITNSWSLLKLCPLSWWCHPTISSSVIPFSSNLQSFPASGSFPMSHESCLYNYSKWLKTWLFFILACYLNRLLQYLASQYSLAQVSSWHLYLSWDFKYSVSGYYASSILFSSKCLQGIKDLILSETLKVIKICKREE